MKPKIPTGKPSEASNYTLFFKKITSRLNNYTLITKSIITFLVFKTIFVYIYNPKPIPFANRVTKTF